MRHTRGILTFHRCPDQDAQDLVRDRLPGRGLIYKDTFSEERVIFLPPAASAILVILSRNHNVRPLYPSIQLNR
jgi:hypothetical protein